MADFGLLKNIQSSYETWLFFENVKGLLEFVHSSSSQLFIIFVVITFIATTIIIIIIIIYSKLIFCRF